MIAISAVPAGTRSRRPRTVRWAACASTGQPAAAIPRPRERRDDRTPPHARASIAHRPAPRRTDASA